MLNFDLQNHRPLREIVYEELKRQILIGEIAPGTRMMEVELAEDMGVSRTPVREAIRKLEKEGLVSIEPRRGAYASDISIKDMVDVLEVRQELEGMAAACAAAKATDEEISVLEDIMMEYKNSAEKGDIQLIIKWDEAFHKQIVSCSGNKTLVQLVSQVQELALRFRYIYYDDFSRFEGQPEEHRHIVEAIKSRNAEVARVAADSHISKLKEFVINEGETVFHGNHGKETVREKADEVNQNM